jgi:hypothetical protein
MVGVSSCTCTLTPWGRVIPSSRSSVVLGLENNSCRKASSFIALLMICCFKVFGCRVISGSSLAVSLGGTSLSCPSQRYDEEASVDQYTELVAQQQDVWEQKTGSISGSRLSVEVARRCEERHCQPASRVAKTHQLAIFDACTRRRMVSRETC